ncbi:MAG: HU family DNA-binding protein [Phocaeicola sp.]
MAIQFDFYETPSPNKSEKKQYHPRVVSSNTLEPEEILKEINHRCSLTDGDVKSCLAELSHSIVQGLKSGRSVHLEGVGYFSITLESTAPETTPTTRVEHIKVKGISFRPENKLKKELATSELKRAEVKKHAARLSNAQVEECIEQHFKESTTLSRVQLERICQLTKFMALKQISRMVEEGKLVNIANRYQAIYIKKQ